MDPLNRSMTADGISESGSEVYAANAGRLNR
jgi:hypothetical protein